MGVCQKHNEVMRETAHPLGKSVVCWSCTRETRAWISRLFGLSFAVPEPANGNAK